MANNTTAQEGARKYGGSSSFVDKGTPSKAPRQDEQGEDAVGAARREDDRSDSTGTRQGISNRPGKDEHAAPPPESDDSQSTADSIDEGPKQVGGNRGQV